MVYGAIETLKTIKALEAILEEKEKMLLAANQGVSDAAEVLSKSGKRYNKFAEEIAALNKAIRAIKWG